MSITANLLPLSAILTACLAAETYYIRNDGGTALQCNGRVDAAYENKSAPNCAWEHPFWALDAAGKWKIAGGDKLLIAGSFMMGYGAPNTGWCSASWTWDCHLPPVPSGPSPAQRTVIAGATYTSGCPVKPELWGTERASLVLSADGSSNYVIECLEITDHESCVEHHTMGAACKRDAFPHGKWAAMGISAVGSRNAEFRDLDIHGLANRGILAGAFENLAAANVRIAGKGWAGWDFDVHRGTNSGNLVLDRLTVEWNGCAEQWDAKGTYKGCWAQGQGGYGDGIGFGATTGNWIVRDSLFRFNTSDGFDALYFGNINNTAPSLTIERSRFEGNAGNQLKVSGSATIRNSLMIGNCGFFSGKEFSVMGTGFNGDNCRAGGDTVAISVRDHEQVSFVNNTITGEGNYLLIAGCGGNCGSASVIMANNIFRGAAGFTQSPPYADFVDAWWNPNGVVRYSAFNNYSRLKAGSTCPIGTGDTCGDPKVVSDIWAALSYQLTAASDLVRAKGLAPGTSFGGFGVVPNDDLTGKLRSGNAPADLGAYQSPAAATIQSLTCGSGTLIAGTSINCQVTLTALAAAPMIVSLETSAGLYAPQTLTIPTSADRATFFLRADAAAASTATISAVLSGIRKSVAVTVTPTKTTDTITLQQGVNGYTCGASATFGWDERHQDPTAKAMYFRYWASHRWYNLVYFCLGDTRNWRRIQSAKLTFFNVGGWVYSPSRVFVRQILDPDHLGASFPMGYRLATAEGYRNAGNKEVRDSTASPAVPWTLKDSRDGVSDNLANALAPLANSRWFQPGNDPVGTAYEVDVSTEVECMRTGACPNQGFATWHESPDANIQYVIGTTLADQPALRPKLTITFAPESSSSLSSRQGKTGYSGAPEKQ